MDFFSIWHLAVVWWMPTMHFSEKYQVLTVWLCQGFSKMPWYLLTAPANASATISIILSWQAESSFQNLPSILKTFSSGLSILLCHNYLQAAINTSSSIYSRPTIAVGPSLKELLGCGAFSSETGQSQASQDKVCLFYLYSPKSDLLHLLPFLNISFHLSMQQKVLIFSLPKHMCRDLF